MQKILNGSLPDRYIREDLTQQMVKEGFEAALVKEGFEEADSNGRTSSLCSSSNGSNSKLESSYWAKSWRKQNLLQNLDHHHMCSEKHRNKRTGSNTKS